jgi:hypothetical protein
MNDQTIQQMQIKLQELEDLMRGRGQEGGFVHATLSLAALVQGTKENPGGLVKRIDEVEEAAIKRAEAQGEKIDKLFKIVYMGAGAAFVVNIAWMIFTHFHK